jgi:hypothetical protein
LSRVRWRAAMDMPIVPRPIRVILWGSLADIVVCLVVDMIESWFFGDDCSQWSRQGEIKAEITTPSHLVFWFPASDNLQRIYPTTTGSLVSPIDRSRCRGISRLGP